MDPNTGKLYSSMEEAQKAMDENPSGRHRTPIEILGDAMVIEELGEIVKDYRRKEEKKQIEKKKAKRKNSKSSRKRNR